MRGEKSGRAGITDCEASVRTGFAMTDLITAKAEPMGSAFAEKREKNEVSVLFMEKPCG